MTGQLDQTSQPCSLPACSSIVGPSWSCAGRAGFDLRTVRRHGCHIPHSLTHTGSHAHAHRTAQSVTAHHNVARTPPLHTARRESSGVHTLDAPHCLQAAAAELQSAFLSPSSPLLTNVVGTTVGPSDAFGTFCGGTFGAFARQHCVVSASASAKSLGSAVPHRTPLGRAYAQRAR